MSWCAAPMHVNNGQLGIICCMEHWSSGLLVLDNGLPGVIDLVHRHSVNFSVQHLCA
jgi:hypothetical protein